jgi:DNA gyrase/topoisomerase IV subunit A
MKRWLGIGLVTGALVIPGVCKADITTLYGECEYVMGDNDTKSDAKQLCLMDAKRKVLERVGTYVESNTTVLNFNLTKDEIRTYAAGIIKTEIVSDNMSFNGKSMVIQMKIKADVDTSVLANRIIEISKDKDLAQKYIKMQDDYKQLERQIRELQEKLGKEADRTTVKKARLEREDAFNKLSELEKIKQDIKTKTYMAVQNVEIGMTRKEVIKLCGPPRTTSDMHTNVYMSMGEPESYQGSLNYGKVWVIFENDIVVLLVDARCLIWDGIGHRNQYFNSDNPCGAGKGIIKR